MSTVVFFHDPNPFVHTVSASLLTPWDARFGAGAASRAHIGEIADAELCVGVACRKWVETNQRLVEVAKECKEDIDPRIQAPPHGFSAQAVVENQERLLMEAEWMISAVLDSLYILLERITASTKAMNAYSQNALWPDITQSMQGNAPKKRIIEQNLVHRFKVDSRGDNGIADAAEALVNLVKFRGDRTHRCHFCAYIVHPEETVVYSDALPHWNRTPKTKFTNAQVMQGLRAGLVLLRWWVAQTAHQLTNT